MSSSKHPVINTFVNSCLSVQTFGQYVLHYDQIRTKWPHVNQMSTSCVRDRNLCGQFKQKVSSLWIWGQIVIDF